MANCSSSASMSAKSESGRLMRIVARRCKTVGGLATATCHTRARVGPPVPDRPGPGDCICRGLPPLSQAQWALQSKWRAIRAMWESPAARVGPSSGSLSAGRVRVAGAIHAAYSRNVPRQALTQINGSLCKRFYFTSKPIRSHEAVPH